MIKKTEKQMGQEEFIDYEEEWRVFESRGAQWAPNNDLESREHRVTRKTGKPAYQFRYLRRKKDGNKKKAVNPGSC